MYEKKAVIIIHGLFMHPIFMQKMANYFKNKNFAVHNYQYNTRKIDLDGIVGDIKVLTEQYKTVHVIGHSLGGLIIRHVFDTLKPNHKGAVFTLGTPHQGSSIAEYFNNSSLKWILGNSPEHGLVTRLTNKWNHPQSLYVFAGKLHIGPLAFLPPLNKKSGDGTVLLEETYLDGAKEHVQVNLSHTALIYSASLCDHIFRLMEK